MFEVCFKNLSGRKLSMLMSSMCVTMSTKHEEVRKYNGLKHKEQIYETITHLVAYRKKTLCYVVHRIVRLQPIHRHDQYLCS